MESKNEKYIYFITVLYFILQTFYLVSEYTITGGNLAVPLDDVWIHFRFAENFAKGYFYQYNPGEPTPGTTSPLWVIFLSTAFLISDELIVAFALFSGSVFFLISVILLYRLCIKLGFSEGYSFIITVLTLFSGRLLWSSLSGMEITAFILLSVIIFISHIKEISSGDLKPATGILLAVAANLRPETYLLALLYYVVSFLLLLKAGKLNRKNLILSILFFIILTLPYPLFSFLHTGSLLPNTYQGQVSSVKYLPDIRFITESSKLFIKDNFIIFILWAASSLYFIYNLSRKKAEHQFVLVYLWIIFLPLISSFIAPNWRHHGRYLIPLIPFINIAAIYILQKFLNSNTANSLKTRFKHIIITVTFLPTLLSCYIFSNTLGWNVENINNQQVKTALWLKNNLPEEKAFGMNDIGAITFITKKYCVDMAGLVTPEIFKIQKMDEKSASLEIFKLLKSKGVNYIIIYPDWFTYITNNYSDILEEVYSARLEKNTICGGVEKFVYKINWNKLKL